MPFDHSIIPPSSAARRVQCNASAIMELLHGNTTDTDEAKEGEASHELAALMVSAKARAGTGYPMPDKTIGKVASNGVIWDQASYDGAEMYAEYMAARMQQTATFTPKIEQRIDIPRIHLESWGTPDCSLFDVKGKTLYLPDYKYGHRPVEVFENWQLIEYTIGLLDEITDRDLADWHIDVVMAIVQPRAPHRDGPIREWRVKASDLRGYANILHSTEHAALGPDPATRTGPECRDCSARHVCDTLMMAGGSVMEFIDKPIPVNLGVDNLSVELILLRKACALIKARLSGLEAQAEGLIQTGTSVPGFALDQGYGRQKWTIPANEILSICDLLGIDVRKPAEAITPKQAIEKGVDESVIKFYSMTPRTSVKLVESSKTLASAVFAKRK